jgi:hypothetical protein
MGVVAVAALKVDSALPGQVEPVAVLLVQPHQLVGLDRATPAVPVEVVAGPGVMAVGVTAVLEL